MLEKIEWGTLFFFLGLFIIVEGADYAGVMAVTASGDQTAASTGALTKSEYGQLAQTGIGISLACAAILLLAGLAYAMKTFVQYKRETSED